MSNSATFDLHDGPGHLAAWQESQFLIWYDHQVGIGGAHRVGHEVPTGLANEQSGLTTRSGHRWRRLRDGLPMTARSSDRFGAGSTMLVADGERLRLEINDVGDEVRGMLVLEDFYEPTPVWNASPEAKSVMAAIAPNHREASGRLRGFVHIGSDTYDVDALFHRDHSWGERDWSNIVSHRWVGGTFGPDLSFSAVILQGPGDNYIRGGALMRNGSITVATDVDIVTYLEADGISHRGGRAVWRLESGETLELDLEAEDGIIIEKETFVATETLCRVSRAGSVDVGFCDFEVSNGAGLDRRGITHALRAVATDGLTQRNSSGLAR